MWSYYYNNSNGTWNGGLRQTGSSPARPIPVDRSAGPAGCGEVGISNIPFEVGLSRNPAAPPVGGANDSLPAVERVTSPAANNKTIMQAVNVMRPYGANPIAGLMDDAKAYFWVNPEGPSNSACQQRSAAAGPSTSSSSLTPLRTRRPASRTARGPRTGTPGSAPTTTRSTSPRGWRRGATSRAPGSRARRTPSASGAPVKTFVVGFSLQTTLGDAGEFSSCKQILSSSNPPTILTDSADCGTPTLNGDGGVAGNPIYASCCALADPVSGGTQVPYFADNQSDLNAALQAILGLISSSTTTRERGPYCQVGELELGGGATSPLSFVSSFDRLERPPCGRATSTRAVHLPATLRELGHPSVYLSVRHRRRRFRLQPEQLRRANAKRHLGGAGAQRLGAQRCRHHPPVHQGGDRDPPNRLRRLLDLRRRRVGLLVHGDRTQRRPERRGDHRWDHDGRALPGNVCNYSQPGMTLNVSDCETIALGWLLGMQTPLGLEHEHRDDLPLALLHGGERNAEPVRRRLPLDARRRDPAERAPARRLVPVLLAVLHVGVHDVHGLGLRAAPYGPLRGHDRRPPPRFRR